MIDLIVYTTPILLLFYRVVERVKKEREKHPLSFYLFLGLLLGGFLFGLFVWVIN